MQAKGPGQNEIPFVLNSKSYQDLKIRVKKAIPYPFATFEWYFKAFLIFGLAVFLEFESLLNGPSVLKALILGVIMAMIGLCIQHDANHGAVSPNGWVNRIWGYTQVKLDEYCAAAVKDDKSVIFSGLDRRQRAALEASPRTSASRLHQRRRRRPRHYRRHCSVPCSHQMARPPQVAGDTDTSNLLPLS